MTKPKVIVNVSCTDPEDRVVETHCAVCRRCFVFVASKQSRKNGTCVFGGPYNGYEKTACPR